MKHIIPIVVILLAGILLFPSALVLADSNTTPAPRSGQLAEVLDPGDEITDLRTRRSKTYWMGGNSYSLVAAISPVHYQDVWGNWLEIDPQLLPSEAPYFWEMTNAGYRAYFKDTFDAGQILRFYKDGQTVDVQPMALEYTNEIEQIQPIAVPSTVTAQVSNNLVPDMLPGYSPHVGNIKWIDAYGANIDFEWSTTNTRLNKILTISDLSDIPTPEAYMGDNVSLRYNLIFAPSSGAYIYVDGVLWDKKTKVTTYSIIEFRDSTNEVLWGFMPLYYWDSSEFNSGQSEATLRKVGNKFYISILVPYTWLESAQFPVYIDTDIDEQVDAGTDDAQEWSGSGNMDLVKNRIEFGYLLAPSAKHTGLRFDGISGLAGATINNTATYLQFYSVGLDSGSFVGDWYGEDAAAAPTFNNTNSNISSRVRTTATCEGDGSDFGNWAASTNETFYGDGVNYIGDIIQELATSYDPSSIVLLHIWTSGTGERLCDSYEMSAVRSPILHIEYTAGGGPSIPTVTTDNTSLVEETTASVSGNITATGGANATARTIQYGTATLTYTANTTEFGDFGVGIFSGNLTGLSPGTTYYVRAGANNSAGWGWGEELNFTTKPQAPTTLTDTARTSSQVTLTWTLGTGSENTTVRYRTDGTYPTDYTDGALSYNGTAATCNMTGLNPSIEHSIGAWAVNTDNTTIYSDNSDQDTAWTRPVDGTNLAADNISYTSLDLEWTLPPSANQTMIRYETDGTWPTDETDGTQAFFNTGNVTPVSGLPSGTAIRFSAWVYSDNSTYYSSGNISVLATTLSVSSPTVVTGNATAISYTTATGQGNITALGGENATVRGGEWGTAPSTYTANWTEAGSFGTGNFTYAMTGLPDNTLIYTRALAVNSDNVGYGAEVSFTTLEMLVPTVTTSNATDITFEGATLPGNITDTGGENAATRGVEWGTASGNYTANQTSAGSFGTGAFNEVVGGLLPSTEYFYRALAVNSKGAGYGAENSFNTTAAAPPGVAPGAAAAPPTTAAAPSALEISQFLPYILLVFFSFLAFWKMNSIIFMILAALAIVIGLETPDLLSGASLTPMLSITVGLMLIVYFLMCAGLSFRLMFWQEPVSNREGEAW